MAILVIISEFFEGSFAYIRILFGIFDTAKALEKRLFKDQYKELGSDFGRATYSPVMIRFKDAEYTAIRISDLMKE